MQRQQDDGLLFAGTVIVRNRRIEGSGFYDVGNTTNLSIQTSSEKKQRVSKRKDSIGQSLDSISIKNPSEIKWGFDTFDRTNLAMALMGESALIAAKAEKVTDEQITIGTKGQWYKVSLDNLDVSKVSVKNHLDAKVETTDFEVNETLGLIMIKPDCANVQDGEIIKVTASTKDTGGYAIDADTVGDYDLEIMLDGINRVTGERIKLHVPSAVVAADSEIDWFNEDFNSASFAGNPVLVAGYKSTYSVKVFA